MSKFGLISEIDIQDSTTWQDKIFITLDIDWAHDDVIRNVASLLVKYNVLATWYVTHNTPVLNELRACELFELGIHPNFNKLLNGDFEKGKNIGEIFDNIIKVVPEAKSFRSHSLTQNAAIALAAYDRGIAFDLNTFIPIDSYIEIRPYRHPVDIIQLPHIWEDDVHCIKHWDYSGILSKIMTYGGLRILDFHPIHIFLNTENVERYNSARPHLKDLNELARCVNNNNYGTRNFIEQLITLFNESSDNR